ncbi:MAG: hypothetical protein JRJ29_20865, partial [Deltaproteobacteria bacterium]|nr:hypothetical protein [Deltaproteobacteria bacterium]
MEGVDSAEFNFGISRLKVVGDARKVSCQGVVQIVEKLGHKVEEEEKVKSAVLHIEGMDCEDETSLI